MWAGGYTQNSFMLTSTRPWNLWAAAISSFYMPLFKMSLLILGWKMIGLEELDPLIHKEHFKMLRICLLEVFPLQNPRRTLSADLHPSEQPLPLIMKKSFFTMFIIKQGMAWIISLCRDFHFSGIFNLISCTYWSRLRKIARGNLNPLKKNADRSFNQIISDYLNA